MTASAKPVLAKPELPQYVTGHCANGNHEGTKRLSPAGALMPACNGTYKYRFVTIVCRCFCHEMYRMLAAEDPDAFAGLVATTDPTDPTGSDALGPSSVVPTFDPPPVVGVPDEHKSYKKLLDTGRVSGQLELSVREWVLSEKVSIEDASADRTRRRRGELETNVEVVCRLFEDGKLPFPQLTTDIIALFIDAENAPSQGAVHAVLTRWEEAGLVHLGRKPMRFEKFTIEVAKYGIEAVKNSGVRDRERRARGFF